MSEEESAKPILLRPIGLVRAPYKQSGDVPKGLGARHDAEGTFEILPEFAAGLADIEVLRDVDYLETMLQTMPEEVEALLARTGTTLAEVQGTVRSVTYRARRGQAGVRSDASGLAVASCCGTDCCGGAR